MSKHDYKVEMDLVPEGAPETYKKGTERDQLDMMRVGKQQELRRNFKFISVLGFTAVLMCSWEAILL
jgi:hypothetical protein